MTDQEWDIAIHSDNEDFGERVKELLLYHRIVKAEVIGAQDGLLTLDNGTQLLVQGNGGCGGCGNGWFYLEVLNTCDNAITDVQCVLDGDDVEGGTYHIFVFAEEEKIELVQYEGYDNGYYGTGYSLCVKLACHNP